MPITGRQGDDGKVVQLQGGEAPGQKTGRARKPTSLERAQAKVSADGQARRAAPTATSQSTTPGHDALNAISVLGLGKMMPLGNIGMALLRESREQTALLQEIRDALISDRADASGAAQTKRAEQE